MSEQAAEILPLAQLISDLTEAVEKRLPADSGGSYSEGVRDAHAYTLARLKRIGEGHATNEKDQHCPYDGQTLAWHLVTERDPNDQPRTNAAFIGCTWAAAARMSASPAKPNEEQR